MMCDRIQKDYFLHSVRILHLDSRAQELSGKASLCDFLNFICQHCNISSMVLKSNLHYTNGWQMKMQALQVDRKTEQQTAKSGVGGQSQAKYGQG